jgi:hypothetical protein
MSPLLNEESTSVPCEEERHLRAGTVGYGENLIAPGRRTEKCLRMVEQFAFHFVLCRLITKAACALTRASDVGGD